MRNSEFRIPNSAFRIGNVRWVTDRRAVASAQADNWGGKRVGSPTHVPPRCFRLAPLAENLTAWQSVSYLKN
ncbi:MAG: hypothetical protein LBQ66_00400 [Planctomycetaceae bacterium]|nr:hypothetical protein [Planctomycetaceae bacterium]